MSQETTYAGILGDLQRFAASLEANVAELGHLDATRLRFGDLLNRAQEVLKQQGALTAAKQDASKQARDLLTEAQRLANVLRLLPLTKIRRNLIVWSRARAEVSDVASVRRVEAELALRKRKVFCSSAKPRRRFRSFGRKSAGIR